MLFCCSLIWLQLPPPAAPPPSPATIANVVNHPYRGFSLSSLCVVCPMLAEGRPVWTKNESDRKKVGTSSNIWHLRYVYT
jgi:hypothetical protein